MHPPLSQWLAGIVLQSSSGIRLRLLTYFDIAGNLRGNFLIHCASSSDLQPGWHAHVYQRNILKPFLDNF